MEENIRLSKKRELDRLNAQMESKGECCQLSVMRKNIVPGEGNPDSQILFIGEGPGQKEDEQGRPFVGSAGQLLNELLASIGLKREDVFIANVVKCRPPNNRDPLPEEVSACWPWLTRQIKIIDPLLIIPLGRHAMERFLPGMKISAIRGKIMRRNIAEVGVKVFMPTYHPAAALYHREWLGALREDFAKIPRILEYLSQNQGNGENSKDGSSQNGDWESLEIGTKKEKQEQGRLL